MTTTWGCTACGHTFPNPPVFANGPRCPSCGGSPIVSPPPYVAVQQTGDDR